ncbi:ABC transporter ATP-binding protein/permease [Rothia sp. AR01]|uniref:ABC transporter ATP-binding protein/permease n=1 Tax=Rothia santali TaxID=2949643 RepID=A0A9X2HFB4_9MICC|nr:ABC transporter ATP-binding protein [Rothia santali]MCP3424666.1 ABC transporter ATP-binding protein/permease [Rothia santali]
MIRTFLRILGPRHARAVRLSLALSILSAALHGAVIALLVPVLARLLGPGPASAAPWTLALLGAAAVYAVVRAASLTVSFRSGGAVSRALHHRLGEHLVRLPVGWYTGPRLGELTHLATAGVSGTTALPVHVLPPLIEAVVAPAVAILVLAVWQWQLAVAAAVGLGLLAAVYAASGRAVSRDDAARDAISAEAADRVLEHARAQQALRAAGRGAESGSALDRALQEEHVASRRLLRTAVPALSAYSAAARLVLTALVALTVLLFLGGSPGGPAAAGLLVLVVRFVQPVAGAAEHGAALRLSGRTVQRIAAVLDTPPQPEPDRPRVPADGAVEFDRVGFSYAPDAAPALRDVSLRAEPGTLTAVVGPSGSGKSTLVQLLARFHDVGSGAVRVGGVDVREIGSRELSRHVALVPQDVYLFDDTVAENLRVAAPGATLEDLDRVAARCGLDAVVAELPRGWETRVGEGGTSLSGGQRQRVAIARALLQDAPVIVLDEASSALDAANEALLTRTARELARDRTVLVVAHRPATITAADAVVVLDAGRVVQRGRPHELAAREGLYAELLRGREDARGWRLVPTAGASSGSTAPAAPSLRRRAPPRLRPRHRTPPRNRSRHRVPPHPVHRTHPARRTHDPSATPSTAGPGAAEPTGAAGPPPRERPPPRPAPGMPPPRTTPPRTSRSSAAVPSPRPPSTRPCAGRPG